MYIVINVIMAYYSWNAVRERVLCSCSKCSRENTRLRVKKINKKLKTKKRETVSKGYYTTTTTIYIYIIIIILSLSLSGFQGFLQLSKTCNDLYYTLLKMA